MKYNLAQVMTVTSNILMVPMDELYQTLNSMVKRNLYTHQLPSAAEAMKIPILSRYPQLDIKVPGWVNSAETVEEWLIENRPVLGDEFEIDSIEVDQKKLDELLTNFMNKGGEVVPVIIDG